MAHVVQMNLFGFVRLRYIWVPFSIVMPHFGHMVRFESVMMLGSRLGKEYRKRFFSKQALSFMNPKYELSDSEYGGR
jgi:hypothetical protein